MRIGQTTAVVFFSKILGAALGFVATLVFARIVGAEVLGIYILVLTLMKWAGLVGDLGIGSAMKKRISEDEQGDAYFTAGLIWIFAVAVVVSIGVVLARPFLEAYISDFDEYISVSVAWFLVALMWITFIYSIPVRVLIAERKAHIGTLLNPLRQGVQSLLQIALVVGGFSLLGMLVGYAVGGLLVGLAGYSLITLKLTRPSFEHFRSLFNYAKYAWFGKLRSRIFNDVDIIILGLFVPTGAVGIYAVAWSLAKFLELFSNAISTTLFPEISYSSTQESMEVVTEHTEDALAYTGLFVIPGFIGGFLLSSELMWIYGGEFRDGAAALSILIFAILLYAYYQQLKQTLAGIDRPDLTFRINVILATVNVVLNLLLIPIYGIEGAAVASVLSVVVAMVMSYYYLSQLVQFTIPFAEITRQITAALSMGVLIIIKRMVIDQTAIVEQNFVIVLILVATGAATYFVFLFGLSSRFRSTIIQNMTNFI